MDQTLFQKALEDIVIAVSQDVTVARVTGYIAYFAVWKSFMADNSTKSELMQNTLFVL
ncbi:hypothetical protein IWQ51_002025 [Labrenzia sp. EL_142]|nr:hypothetical protein [Labrenzia sp. EL_142]